MVANIGDLIRKDKTDDESHEAKFEKKQKEIKQKEIERQVESISTSKGIPYVNLFGFPISPDALILINEEEARKKNIISFFYDGKNIRLATTNTDFTESEKILKKINEEHHTKGKIYLISQYSIDHAFDLYKSIPKKKEHDDGVEIKEEDLIKFEAEIKDYKSLNDKINKVSVSDIVTLIIATALKVGSSDIHIEAEEKEIVVRLRIDGILQKAASIESSKWKKIVARMKILAGVKINIDNQPQDGRYTIFLKDDKVDVRSSFLPTSYGESVVMRLLKSSSIGLSFEDLGINSSVFNRLKKEIEKPNGMILTTGPTGSGKTTTLYSMLSKLNQPGTKIITLEDPIEYHLKGVNQSQVNPKAKYTFANGLRSIVRQDPDIIMVGEIRDLETAEIAVQASLTGHLVLSTLHTNDASGVIPRLIDLGVKPYFITPSINAVIGQRLVRILCPECKVKHELDSKDKELVEKILSTIPKKANIEVPTDYSKLYKAGEGCKKCNGLGYKGRIGIYEIFTMDDDIKQLTTDEAPAFKILRKAIDNGMITMLQDGILKCFDGITDLKEIYRVIGNFDYIEAIYEEQKHDKDKEKTNDK